MLIEKMLPPQIEFTTELNEVTEFCCSKYFRDSELIRVAVYMYWMTRISVVLQKGLNAALVRRVAAAVNKSGGYGVGQVAVDVFDQTAVFVDRNMH
jgi:hypothetical protein